MICGGHYATEVFGVQQVAKELSEKFGLETSFLALPTAL
jgi:putative NIF3 family GTP cyclohydrolase 1 type 2